MAISRDEFLQAARPKEGEVEITGLGTVAIRQWSYEQVAYAREMRMSKDTKEGRRATLWLVAQSVLQHPNGPRMFESDADIDQLGKLNSDIIAELVDKIASFSDADAGALLDAGEASGETSTSASS